MKIFNWMHKRFHHNNNLKDGFSSNMKKNETLINNIANHQALLKQVALTDMLGGWKDGILTIGTLGYDSLKEHYDMVHDDADDVENFYNAEQEELNPLINNTFEHNFEDVVCENHDDDANKEEEITIRTFKEIVVVTPLICNEIMEEANDVEADQKKRITLADLFLADSDVKIKLHYPAPKVLLEPCEKPNIKSKHGFSFAKKIIPLVKDNARPIKDIKKLMKKMLKRKIHPDLDVKNHKAEGQEINEEGIIIDNNMINEASDSSYFLPI